MPLSPDELRPIPGYVPGYEIEEVSPGIHSVRPTFKKSFTYEEIKAERPLIQFKLETSASIPEQQEIPCTCKGGMMTYGLGTFRTTWMGFDIEVSSFPAYRCNNCELELPLEQVGIDYHNQLLTQVDVWFAEHSAE